MTVRTDPTDPANMSSDDRLAEVAAILAEGVRRLRRRAAIPGIPGETATPKESEEFSRNGLDVCP